MPEETRELLVFGEKTFKISVPLDAKITFGPFSPPTAGGRDNWAQSGRATGTLRIYKTTKDNIIAVFTDVRGFRDLSLGYAEEVAREEGAALWKSDNEGYFREERVQRSSDWIEPAAPAIATAEPKKKK